MSSPAPVPAPQPRRRSVAGAVVLILLGIVLLLSTTGVLHGYKLWEAYGKFWPALIILWGVIKLVEHQQAQREGTRGSGIGAGGVFLLIFLIISGLAATSTSRINWRGLHDEIGWDEGDLDNLFGESFSYTDQLEQPFPAGGSLRIVSDRGAVNIQVADENKIKVSIEKKVHAENQQSADKYNEGTKPTINTSDRVVTLNANTQAAGDHGIATDMTITIPRKAAVTVSTRHGDVVINGREGDVNVSNQHGDVTVQDVKGNASLNVQHSSVKALNIAGDVSVEGRVDDLTISDIKGGARLNGEFMESVKLTNIAKMVTFKSSRTDLEFAKLDGSLDLDSGDLRASSFGGPARLITKSKDVVLDQVSGDLKLEDANGSVQVHVSKMGNLQIENRSGDVQIALPPGAAFRVDARARNGEIQSDWSELKIEDQHDQAVANGTVGSGTSNLKINNEHGTIEIRKGSIDAAAPPSPPATPKAPRSLPTPKDNPEETEN